MHSVVIANEMGCVRARSRGTMPPPRFVIPSGARVERSDPSAQSRDLCISEHDLPGERAALQGRVKITSTPCHSERLRGSKATKEESKNPDKSTFAMPP